MDEHPQTPPTVWRSTAAVADLRAQRLPGLDGLRGLGALFVVVNHVFLRAFPGHPVDHAPFWAGPFIYGRFAVIVFIVLSGFSLALSPARHGWRLDAVSRFAQRRARRILPAYWAALAFSLAVAWLVVPQPGQGVPDAKSVVVNGLLLQNVVRAPSPNASFWSMAVEAQLYIAFPLMLLMVRRWGAIAMVATVTLGVSSYSLYLIHGPIVVLVYEKIVAVRVGQGVPAFLVSLALVLPLTIVFARVFASVFETPFLRQRRTSGTVRRQQPRAAGAA